MTLRQAQGKRKQGFIILGILFGFNILAWVGVLQLNHGNLEVTFFDIGQGDAALIKTPEGHQILIDGGPSSIILEKLGREMPFWDRTIDLIILTHPEHDHLAGLLDVLKRYEVQNILWTGVVRDTAEFKEWQKLIEEEGADVFIAHLGQQVNCSEPNSGCSEFGSEQCRIDILYPFESLEGQEFKDSNNTSIVNKLVCGKNSFLFTGDVSKSVEKQLLGLAEQLNVDVLKVGHHGSKNSSSEEFIKAVSPEIAVISAGKDNSYGHPHAETLAVLQNYGIRTLERTLNASHLNVLRTDINGDIKIICPAVKIRQLSGCGIIAEHR